MTNQRALTRVREDLAAGRRSAAVRRLRAALAANPADREAYRLLTEIHRNEGNAAEAGRWGYLTGDATDEEIAAFERIHPQPWVRLRLLGQSLDPQRLPGDLARTRLAALHEQASEATIPIQRPAGVPGQVGSRPGAGRGDVAAGRGAAATQRQLPKQRRSPGVEWPAEPSRAAAVPGSRSRPRWLPTAARRRAAGSEPSPERTRSRAALTRNYLLLAMLIVVGGGGSLGAVVWVRAIFGIDNWLSPVEAIISAVRRAFGS